MVKRAATVVRAFDGSLADAEGMLSVERASFDESPYLPHQIREMLNRGPQRAWLAVAGRVVVGFVVSFATQSLQGPMWEIDLLAVRPSWRGRGLATRLVRASCAYGAGLAGHARSVVSADNPASAQVFRRAGFRASGEACGLYVWRVGADRPSLSTQRGIRVRTLSDPAEISARLTGIQAGPVGSSIGHGFRSPAGGPRDNRVSRATYLVAGGGNEPQGYAELIEVETLLYRGVWIESFGAQSPEAADALVRHTKESAWRAGYEEVGAMAPASDRFLQGVLRAAGFVSLGTFHWFEAALPLPGWAGPVPDVGSVGGLESGIRVRHA